MIDGEPRPSGRAHERSLTVAARSVFPTPPASPPFLPPLPLPPPSFSHPPQPPPHSPRRVPAPLARGGGAPAPPPPPRLCRPAKPHQRLARLHVRRHVIGGDGEQLLEAPDCFGIVPFAD